MPKLFDMTGNTVGEVELNPSVFGIKPSVPSMHFVIRAHLCAKRQGNQSALTRAEVSGGGIKPWRQKGTGRARQGSTRSPQWTHGGIVFAPKPRSYDIKVNKKIRRLALRSAFSVKAAGEQTLFVIDNLDLPAIKTKDFKAFLDALGVSGKTYVVTPEVRENVVRSARNLPGITTAPAEAISAYDLINAKTLIIDQTALQKIEEVYAS